MELVFEMQSSQQFVSTDLRQKTFTQAGGIIGRGEDCDWVIVDRKRHLSSHHAMISYRDGAFYLTDTSSNGIEDLMSGVRLKKGDAVRIETGSLYRLGDFEIRARLNDGSAHLDAQSSHPRRTGDIIPEDVLIELDPLKAVERQEPVYSGISELDDPYQTPMQRADYARIDTENLTVPQLIDPPVQPPPVRPKTACHEDFWERFGAALGVDFRALDCAAREALALDAVHLLKQSVAGIQQCLRTRSELKSELRLARTTVQGLHTNPLKMGVDASEALAMLLTSKAGQLPAEQALSRAFRDLQAHQVALLAGSRAVIRGTLEHFSPQQLSLRLDRDSPSLINTAGSRWRAYGRYHQALLQDDDWSERWLARGFTYAYEEQDRLISTLHTDLQG